MIANVLQKTSQVTCTSERSPDYCNLTLILLFTTTPIFANSVDSDQMASKDKDV